MPATYYSFEVELFKLVDGEPFTVVIDYLFLSFLFAPFRIKHEYKYWKRKVNNSAAHSSFHSWKCFHRRFLQGLARVIDFPIQRWDFPVNFTTAVNVGRSGGYFNAVEVCSSEIYFLWSFITSQSFARIAQLQTSFHICYEQSSILCGLLTPLKQFSVRHKLLLGHFAFFACLKFLLFWQAKFVQLARRENRVWMLSFIRRAPNVKFISLRSQFWIYNALKVN